MISRCFSPVRNLAVAAIFLAASTGMAAAHGAVSMENDRCVLKIGPWTLHFAGYQPDKARSEFCEDIPEIGRTAIVLDMVQQDLRDIPIGFRLEKVGTGGETEVLVDEPAIVRPSGTMTIKYNFTQVGQYTGIITAPIKYGPPAVFPFSVGVSRFPWYTVLGVAALVGLGGGWVLRRSLAQLRRAPPSTASS